MVRGTSIHHAYAAPSSSEYSFIFVANALILGVCPVGYTLVSPGNVSRFTWHDEE